ncbi:MAG TPA: head-tail connector protein [Acetobacteraceae bacterium]|nr:head-tail connector protein [Acetobacteraceae bacterium]
MYASLAVTTPPAAEPVSVELARLHCRIDTTDDDAILAGLITAARSWVENFLGRALIAQTLLWTVAPQSDLAPERIHRWPRRIHGTLELPRAPVQSIVSVAALDDNLTAWTLANPDPITGDTDYTIDLALEPARLHLDARSLDALGVALPIRHLQVSFVTGYPTPAAVPQPIVQAILLLIAFYYEHRGDGGGEVPAAVETLLWMHRVMFFA